MRINDFLKKIASDMLNTNKEFSSEDFYYILKYINVQKDKSYVDDIENFYASFIENLNNSLIKYFKKDVKSQENATHYIAFYASEKAKYEQAIKVYFPVKYEYMISALKTVFSYLIRNHITSTVKFHVKATNENIVIRFYNPEDVIPFLNYCHNNFILDDLLEKTNPFIATIYGLGIVKDDNTHYTYNSLLSLILKDYFQYLKVNKSLNRISDIAFLDYIIKRKEQEDNPVIKFDYEAIEKNIKAILTNTSPLE